MLTWPLPKRHDPPKSLDGPETNLLPQPELGRHQPDPCNNVQSGPAVALVTGMTTLA